MVINVICNGEIIAANEENMKTDKKSLIVVIASAMALLSSVLIIVLIYFNCITINTYNNVSVELGETYYIDTFVESVDTKVKNVEVMFVDNGETKDSIIFDSVGTHEVEIFATNGKKHKMSTVAVVTVNDTILPEFSVDERIIFEKNKSYEISDVIKDAYDYSGIADSYLLIDNEECKDLKFNGTGEFSATAVVVDNNGNETSKDINYIVDAPPVFAAVYDRKISVGKEIDPLEYVLAVDFEDYGVAEVSVDTGDYDCNTEGIYTIKYTAVDSNGLETTQEVKYEVTKEESEKTDVGSWNEANQNEYLKLLCDCGYFKYDALAEENYDEMLPNINATCVEIEMACKSNSNWEAYGNIYKVTPEGVYLTTVEHVFQESRETVYLTFYDEEYVETNYENYIYVSKADEVALVKFDIKDFPKDILLKLKETNINYDVYESMDAGSEIVMYTPNWERGVRNNSRAKDLIIKTEVRNMAVDYTNNPDALQWRSKYIETVKSSQRGMSGSAVFNYKGEVVGFVSFDWNGHGYLIRLENLKELEKRIDELQ